MFLELRLLLQKPKSPAEGRACRVPGAAKRHEDRFYYLRPNSDWVDVVVMENILNVTRATSET